MHTSLSQDVGKRSSGKSRVNAAVEDIDKRSQPRRYSCTGSAYSVVRSGNLIKIEFSQTGDRHDVTRYVIVGELLPTGFKSYSALSCEGLELSWDEIADLIGANPDRLMASVQRFAAKQGYIPCNSSRDYYSTRANNRKKRDKCDRITKGIAIR